MGKQDKFFIEQRPQKDYAVREADSKRASAIASTQEKAIRKAERLNPNATILVERVRDTKVGGRDKWRKP